VSDHGLSGLLGAGSTWNGELCFDGRVRIDGLFDGKVSTPDFLEIGTTGEVRGTVDAAQVLVAGLVDGTVKARERITVLETARVRGRLEAPWIDVRAGAQVDAWIAAVREMVPHVAASR
jgi:cytoskeletal protein CcmA (bactofilin family)